MKKLSESAQLGKVPKCRVEFKWFFDLFWFVGFLLISLLIPMKTGIPIHEIVIYIGIGFTLGVSILKDHSRVYVLFVSVLIVGVIFYSKLTWNIVVLIDEALNFVRYIIHANVNIFLGLFIGSVGSAIVSYKLCKRGEAV